MPTIQQVVNLIAAPPFGIVTRDPGAFTLSTGQYALTRPTGPINVDAVGIAFSFFTIPVEFGWREGINREYDLKICEFAPLYHSLSSIADPGGHDFYAGTTEIHHEGEYYFFPQLLPTRVDVWVQVGCTVVVDWLLAL